jgi:putative ABC transport system permease protein
MRSLWRTKLRLFAVTMMVTIGVFAGISFGMYANVVSDMYEDTYLDDEEGINLPDIWVKNPGGTWNQTTSENLCQLVEEEWSSSILELESCESRLILPGLMYHENKGMSAIWHGIDEGNIDRVWFPEHNCCSGRIAETVDEIVIDYHVAKGLEIELNDVVLIGAGFGKMDYTVVGIGLHSNHFYFAEQGSILPADVGTFATGYLTDEGLEKLANVSAGTSNTLLIDVKGSPEYNLLSTSENEGPELESLIENLTVSFSLQDGISVVVHDRSGEDSVEFLRADVEGAKMMYPYVTGMIAVIAGVTIFLSLQRLIQSQAKEIAVLRTLGVPRTSIMQGYVIAPLVIGSVGSLIGALLGWYVGGPGMLGFYSEIIGIPIVLDTASKSIISENVMIAMVIVFISGIRPAWQASRLQPLEVFRGQNEVRISSRTIQKLTAKLPATIGLTIRSSIRKPIRLAFTFFALGLSMVLFGTMFMMMGSMEDIFGANNDYDAQVYIPIDGEGEVVNWAQDNGVNYELVLQYPGTPEGDNRQFLIYGLDKIETKESQLSMMGVNLKEGELPIINSTTIQVLIDEGTSKFLDWQTGDQEIIMLASTPLNVEISGITKGDMQRTIYFHRADLSQIVNMNATSVLLSFSEEVVISSDLEDLSIGISTTEDMQKSMDTLMEQQQGIMYAMNALGLLIAFAVLFNTLVMNIAERDFELSTLRVLGAPINKLGIMLLGEHIFIGIIGGLIACLASVFMANLMLDSMVQWAFYFTIEPTFYHISVIGGIVLGMAVGLTPLGMRRIYKMNLVEKIKDLSQ